MGDEGNCWYLLPHLGRIWADLSGLLRPRHFNDSRFIYITKTCWTPATLCHALGLSCGERMRRMRVSYSPCGTQTSKGLDRQTLLLKSGSMTPGQSVTIANRENPGGLQREHDFWAGCWRSKRSFTRCEIKNVCMTAVYCRIGTGSEDWDRYQFNKS